MTSEIVSFNIKPLELTKLRVLIADDHPVFRHGLKELLKANIPYIRVIHEAANGVEVLKKLNKEKYHLVFMDIDMPEKDGLSTLREIRHKYKDQRVIILTTHNNCSYILKAQELSANGYISKEIDAKEIERCIKEVCAGISYYQDSIREIYKEALVNKFSQHNIISRSVPGAELTSTERDILILICKEYNSNQIAKELGCSEATVKWHRNNIKSKINCTNVTGMVTYAIKHKIHLI